MIKDLGCYWICIALPSAPCCCESQSSPVRNIRGPIAKLRITFVASSYFIRSLWTRHLNLIRLRLQKYFNTRRFLRSQAPPTLIKIFFPTPKNLRLGSSMHLGCGATHIVVSRKLCYTMRSCTSGPCSFPSTVIVYLYKALFTSFLYFFIFLAMHSFFY